jgi:hypothetical protein
VLRRGECLDEKHLRKTLAGCSPGYEINVHGAQAFADEPQGARQPER